MKASDIIVINVVGTNKETRQTKAILARFNGLGQEIDLAGNLTGSASNVLKGLPTGAGVKPPAFPSEAFAAAQAEGLAGADKARAILLAFTEQMQAWEQGQGGGTTQVQIIKSVLEFANRVHGMKQEDHAGFVLKPENLDVQTKEVDGSQTIYTVSGTAIFG